MLPIARYHHALMFVLLFCTGMEVIASPEEDELLGVLRSNTTRYSPSPDMVDNTVYVDIYLYQIIGVNEKTGLVTAKFFYSVYYFIPKVADIMQQYNKSYLIVPGGTFWIPDLTLTEQTDSEYQNFIQQKVSSSGQIVCYSSMEHIEFSCPMDFHYFPYDRQTCSLSFNQWLSEDDFQIKKAREHVSIEFYQESDQWKLTLPVKYERTAPNEFEVIIEIKRYPEFYLCVLIVPSLTLSVLSTLTFYLPVESGEKVSLSITLLLSQIFTLLVLADILPPTGPTLPLLGLFYCGMVVMMGLTVVAAAIVVRIHNTGNCKKVPQFAINLLSCPAISWVMPAQVVKAGKKARIKVIKVSSSDGKRSPVNENKDASNNQPAPKFETDLSRSKESDMWKLVACGVDRILLIIYSIVLFGVVSSFMIIMS